MTGSEDGLSVPTMRASRVGSLPWLKMTTASASAGWALTAFSANGQVPRWTSAMSVGPEVEPREVGGLTAARGARGGVRLMSTGVTLPVMSPLPEPVNVPVS